MPSRATLSAQERSLYSQLRRLLNEPGLLRGNLVEMKRKCGKQSCRCDCDRDYRHGSLYLGVQSCLRECFSHLLVYSQLARFQKNGVGLFSDYNHPLFLFHYFSCPNDLEASDSPAS